MKRQLLTMATGVLGLLSGCGDEDTAVMADYMAWETGLVDFDQDGYDEPEDCDDEDAAVNPGATEDCDNGIDDDCDDQVDAADEDCA